MSRRKPYTFQEPAKQPPRTWRSLEEKQSSAETLREAAEAERPGGFLDARSVTSRRTFMQVSAMTAAAVGAQGCIRRSVENIVPYTQGPEYLQPGIPLHYATATARMGDAIGLLVTSHEGRPTRVEGNPLHPSSGGATDISAQVSILDLYDSDRAKAPSKKSATGRDTLTLEQFDEAFAGALERHRQDGGRGLRFLMPPTNSPSVLRMREQAKLRFSNATFHTYASVNDSNVIEGAKLAFGQPVRAVYRFDRAKVVLSLDSDFLGEETGSVRNARGFGQTRRIANAEAAMSRLYVAEAGYSITGASADHRLRIPASQVEAYAKAVAAKLAAAHGVDLGPVTAALAGAAPAGVEAAWIDAVAADLAGSRGGALVVVGRRQPARLHALAHAINAALGAIGEVVDFVPAVDTEEGDSVASIKALVEAGSSVRTLVILGGNPVYDAPADLNFTAFMGQQNLQTFVLSPGLDETAKLATYHCPAAHELETWGDQRAVDGTLTIQQPMIESLWLTRAALELLAVVGGERNWRASWVVRETARRQASSLAVFERDFRRMLHAGVVANSAFSPRADIAVLPDAVATALRSAPPAAAVTDSALEVQFVACPKLHDGRHANNLWALELPDPMTRLVWDNAAIVSKNTRDRLNARNGDIVRIKVGDRQVELPVFALPGIADNCVTVALGWGRTDAGRYGSGKGFDVQKLRTVGAFHIATGAQVEKTGGFYELVQTQEHDRMEGRPIAIDATVDEYKEEPNFASYRTVEFNNGPLWTEASYEGRHKWGMVIDLSACTGCNACVVACQSENNIPTVGKREVGRGREMFWIRIDRYFVGDSDANPQVALQPVGCQHCEEAPCENVCPVNATAHSPEGLNDMAYNRCIGTRYCANNCPYKVRRFNYLDWHTVMEEFEPATNNVDHLFVPPHAFRTYGQFDRVKQMQFNPNVTVRMRGVIEKCSYCVQRIQEAKIAARREQRAIGANEIVTACQTVCAPGAIVFGDLNNRESQVAALAERDRRYKLLAEIGTQPRTTFLAKIRNPNPALGGRPAQAAGHEEAHQ